MKKILSGFICVLLAVSMLVSCTSVSADTYPATELNIKPYLNFIVASPDGVYVDGEKCVGATSCNRDGNMMMSALAFGSEERSDGVAITKDGKTLYFLPDCDVAFIDGGYFKMSTNSFYDGAHFFVPFRFVCEYFGYEVSYNSVKQCAYAAKRGFYDNVSYELSAEKKEEIKKFVFDKTDKINKDHVIGYANETKRGQTSGGYGVDSLKWTDGYLMSLNCICDKLGGAGYKDFAKTKFQEYSDTLYSQQSLPYYSNLGFGSMMEFYDEYFKNVGNPNIVNDAAEWLYKRTAPVGYIHPWADSWQKSENARTMVADSICSLSIWMQAAKEYPKYAQMAQRHSDICEKYIIRNDFTSAHTGVFDSDGNFVQQKTSQGMYDDSCWSRGQAWLVLGYAERYLHTGDERYITTFKQVCDLFLSKCENDMMPRWDFVFQSNTAEPFDTSAAAICAYGMMKIYNATKDEFYKEAASRIITVLYDRFSTKDIDDASFMLLGAAANKKRGEYDQSLIYGDYFFAATLNELIKAD